MSTAVEIRRAEVVRPALTIFLSVPVTHDWQAHSGTDTYTNSYMHPAFFTQTGTTHTAATSVNVTDKTDQLYMRSIMRVTSLSVLAFSSAPASIRSFIVMAQSVPGRRAARAAALQGGRRKGRQTA